MYRSSVTYSVAVYLGLLLAGALIGPPPTTSVGASRPDRPGWQAAYEGGFMLRDDPADFSTDSPLRDGLGVVGYEPPPACVASPRD